MTDIRWTKGTLSHEWGSNYTKAETTMYPKLGTVTSKHGLIIFNTIISPKMNFCCVLAWVALNTTNLLILWRETLILLMVSWPGEPASDPRIVFWISKSSYSSSGSLAAGEMLVSVSLWFVSNYFLHTGASSASNNDASGSWLARLLWRRSTSLQCRRSD